MLALVNDHPFADLSEADVALRPSGWLGSKPDDFTLVKSTNLSGKDLRYARASSAFVVKADLSGADLLGAFLGHADLRQADLEGANLRSARLYSARLDSSILSGADMQNVDLSNAILDKATSSTGLNLRYATCYNAHFVGVRFRNVFKDVDLRDAEFENADMKRADIPNAKLNNADLASTDLRGANLQGVNLTNANLNMAHLEGANLHEAIGLTQVQLRLAFMSNETIVDSPLTNKGGRSPEKSAPPDPSK